MTGEAAGTCGFRFQLSFTAAARSFMIDGVGQAGEGEIEREREWPVRLSITSKQLLSLSDL